MRPELDDLKKSVGYMDRGLAWGWKGVEVSGRGGRGWKRVEPPSRWVAVCLLQTWREVSGIVDLARCK